MFKRLYYLFRGLFQTENHGNHIKMECKICYNAFNQSIYRPRILQCGHTFCECCLTKLL